MTTELMIKKFKTVEVFFMEDEYINATKTAKEFGKQASKWLENDDTKEYIKAISKKLLIEQNQLVIVKSGAPSTGGGTWLHPKLAIRFARWISIEFELWCDEQIERILHNYQVSNLRPQFPTVLHPILHFPVVGRQEDVLMKRTRNTYTAVLDSLGFAAAVYKRVLTNNVSRILIGMPIKPFRRLHGIPAGSTRRTRLYYDSNLRRTMDEIEDIACVRLLENRPDQFEDIEQVVYAIAATVRDYVRVRHVDLLEHIPEQELRELIG